jgi:hypothetical protein
MVGIGTVFLFTFIQVIQTYHTNSFFFSFAYFSIFAVFLSFMILLDFLLYYNNWSEIQFNVEAWENESKIAFKGLKTENISSPFYYYWIHLIRIIQLGVLIVSRFITVKAESYTQDSEENLYPAEIAIIILHSVLLLIQLLWMIYVIKIRPWRS